MDGDLLIRPLAWVLAEHDEAVAVGDVAACKGGLCLHLHLAGACGASELLDAVGVEDGPGCVGYRCFLHWRGIGVDPRP